MNNQITKILSGKVNGRDPHNQAFSTMYPETKKLANAQLSRLNTGQTTTPCTDIYTTTQSCFIYRTGFMRINNYLIY